jgi:hypothetical protein
MAFMMSLHEADAADNAGSANRGVPCTIDRYPAPARIADAHEKTGTKGLSV